MICWIAFSFGKIFSARSLSLALAVESSSFLDSSLSYWFIYSFFRSFDALAFEFFAISFCEQVNLCTAIYEQCVKACSLLSKHTSMPMLLVFFSVCFSIVLGLRGCACVRERTGSHLTLKDITTCVVTVAARCSLLAAVAVFFSCSCINYHMLLLLGFSHK